MIFVERKKENGFTYDLEDVFGTLHIVSEKKLTADILDGMIVVLLKQTLQAQIVKGEVSYEGGKVEYVFTKRPQWEDDDEPKQPCENTPTSTVKPESVSTRTRPSIAATSNWLRRFVGAFREAWKKAGGGYQHGQRESDAGKNL